MNNFFLDLQWFTEAGAPAAEAPAAAETAGSEMAAENEPVGPIQAGDTLADGTPVKSAKVAAALEKQMKRHPELRQVYGQGRGRQGQAQTMQAAAGQAPQPDQTQADTIQARWEELKKGEYRDLYGQDVQRAIQERFKNQADAGKQLESMQPMLQALMKKAGVESVEELSKLILDDDSLYEDEAEEMGMTVERYKQFKALQEEHDRRAAEDAKNRQRAFIMNHFRNLTEQAENLKQTFPNFNLQAEMQNETFKRLTMPGSGVSLEDAYYAVHRRELGPQIMAYGMNRAREQMGQTLQAQRKRPNEGAMTGQSQAAKSMKINPKNLDRKERDRIRDLIMRKQIKVSFDD